MSKSSRRSGRRTPAPGTTPAGGDGAARPRPATSTSPTGTTRAGRRARPRSYAQQSFLERFRTPIIGVVVVALIGLVGAFVFIGASQPAYACTTEWTPDPTPTPAPGTSPRLGYVQTNLGQQHGAEIGETYTLCPPASGTHINQAGRGPIRAGVYGPDDTGVAIPQGWIHNLEHGGLVVLYNPELAPESTGEAQQSAFRQFYSTFPDSPICGAPATSDFGGVIVARFDQMAFPYAALVWNRVLPLDEWNPDLIREFFAQEGELTAPELTPGCTRSSPSPAASPAPSAS